MRIRLAGPITRDSIVDGPGLRAVIWTQGCPHHCPGCHNPLTHDPSGGFEMETADLIAQLDTLHLQQGVTFSGGEPFRQPRPLAEVARAVRSRGLSLWSFSGYTFEQLTDPSHPEYADRMELLRLLDVLVDGPFILARRDLSLHFRGSSNQRLVDVPKSLQAGRVRIAEEYMERAAPVRVHGA